MRRQALSFVSLLCSAACAQIAGFEDLTAGKAESAEGAAVMGGSSRSDGESAGKPAVGGSEGGMTGASGRTFEPPPAGEGSGADGSGGSGASDAEGGATSAGGT